MKLSRGLKTICQFASLLDMSTFIDELREAVNF